MNDWRDFKKSFTQQQEDAFWQYFIDHSTVQQTGLYRIMFHVRDVDDFWRRLYARYTGNFSRYNKLEKQQENERLNIHITKKMADRMHQNVQSIEQSGSLQDKIALYLYRKTRKYIEGYGNKPTRHDATNTSRLIRAYNA